MSRIVKKCNVCDLNNCQISKEMGSPCFPGESLTKLYYIKCLPVEDGDNLKLLVWQNLKPKEVKVTKTYFDNNAFVNDNKDWQIWLPADL